VAFLPGENQAAGAPVNIFAAEATHERAENARMVGFTRVESDESILTLGPGSRLSWAPLRLEI
jgi:hypothetical protein